MQCARERKGYASTIKSLGGTAFIAILFILSACAGIPVEKRPQVREEIDRGALETIEKVVAEKPEVRELIDSSPGYFAGRISGATVGVVGVSKGLGVLVDKEKQTRTYMDIDRFDLGVGVGARGYSVLSVIKDREMLEGVSGGVDSAGLGTEKVVGEEGVVARTKTVGGVTTYFVPETGASTSTTVQWVSVAINNWRRPFFDLVQEALGASASKPVDGSEIQRSAEGVGSVLVPSDHEEAHDLNSQTLHDLDVVLDRLQIKGIG